MMPGGDRLTEGHRGTGTRGTQQGSTIPLNPVERAWADDNPQGYWALVAQQAAYGFLLYNFDIDAAELKSEHVIFLHRNARFQEWLRSAVHSATRIHIRGFASASGTTTRNDVLALGRSRAVLSELFTLPIMQPGPQHGNYNPQANITVMEAQGQHGRLQASGFARTIQRVDPESLEGRGDADLGEGHRIAVDRSVLIYVNNPCGNGRPLTPEETHRFAADYLARVLNNGTRLPDYNTFWMPALELFERIIPAPALSRSNTRGTQVPPQTYACSRDINGALRSIQAYYPDAEYYIVKDYISKIYCSKEQIEARILSFISTAKQIVNRAYGDPNTSLYHRTLTAMTQSGFNNLQELNQFRKALDCMRADPNCLLHYL